VFLNENLLYALQDEGTLQVFSVVFRVPGLIPEQLAYADVDMAINAKRDCDLGVEPARDVVIL
jgi:hypothetical protein